MAGGRRRGLRLATSTTITTSIQSRANSPVARHEAVRQRNIAGRHIQEGWSGGLSQGKYTERELVNNDVGVECCLKSRVKACVIVAKNSYDRFLRGGTEKKKKKKKKGG